MEALDLLMTAYLGQSMEEEYTSLEDAIMFFFEENDEEMTQELVSQARQVLEMGEAYKFIVDNNIEWNFEESDEQVRSLMKMIVDAGSG